MNIYFAGSIRSGRERAGIYHDLIEYLSSYGKVLTEHIGNPTLQQSGETGITDEEIFRRDMDMLGRSKIIVAEVTIPSLGVGYEIGQAIALKKRVLCLYHQIDGAKLSAMISGNPSLTLRNYNIVPEAYAHIDDFINKKKP